MQGLVQLSSLIITAGSSTGGTAVFPKPTTPGNTIIVFRVGSVDTSTLTYSDDKAGGSQTYTMAEAAPGYKYSDHAYKYNSAAIQNVSCAWPSASWMVFFAMERDDIDFSGGDPLLGSAYNYASGLSLSTAGVACGTSRAIGFGSSGSFEGGQVFNGISAPFTPILGLADPSGRRHGCVTNNLDGDDTSFGQIILPNGGTQAFTQAMGAGIASGTIFLRGTFFKLKDDTPRVVRALLSVNQDRAMR